MNISVIGAGSWGTAIACVLAENNNKVTLWARSNELAEALARGKENVVYLPGVRLPESISVTSDISAACHSQNVLVLAVPSHVVRTILGVIKDHVDRNMMIVSLVKGLEVDTGLRMSQVITEALGVDANNIAILSGPNHAEEVSKGIPTATVISSANKKLAADLQKVVMTPLFRVYTNSDPLGVEIAGAVKNVIAIAAGISDGLGFGDNTKASLMTRGLTEMSRLGEAAGAQVATFSGLAGIGDLIATCTSKHSRNRLFGHRIGKGEKIQDIKSSMKMVAEGVFTSKAVRTLANKMRVEMPICEEVYQVIYENKPPLDSVNDLMQRDATYEN